MANNKPIAEQLQLIADAKVYSTHESSLAKDLDLVRAYAKSLLILGVENWLPPRENLGPSVQRQYQATPSDDATIRQSIADCYILTSSMCDSLQQLEVEPTDASQRNAIQTRFLLEARRFIEAWNVIRPALSAASGESEIERFQMGLKKMEEGTKQVAAIVSATQDAAKEVGAAKHSKAFETLHLAYETKATTWLKRTILAIVILVLAVIASGIWIFAINDGDSGRLLQVAVGKVVGLGVLYYLILFCAKSHRAYAHLAAVNQHRATALQTLETFVNSSSDEQTKNAVLLETTRCIYGQTSSGFLTGVEPSSPVQIVEILKALSPGSKTN